MNCRNNICRTSHLPRSGSFNKVIDQLFLDQMYVFRNGGFWQSDYFPKLRRQLLVFNWRIVLFRLYKRMPILAHNLPVMFSHLESIKLLFKVCSARIFVWGQNDEENLFLNKRSTQMLENHFDFSIKKLHKPNPR
jgi:hypothetical protein